MEQEKDVSEDLSLLKIESSEKNPSSTIETDEVRTGTDTVDNASDGQKLDEASKHIGLEKDDCNNEGKIVASADAQGHDLLAEGGIPKYVLSESSKSVSADLNVPQSGSGALSPRKAEGKPKSKRRTFNPKFRSPILEPMFLQKVCQQNVLLENVLIQGTCVKGTIAVRNLTYQKLIRVIYTTNNFQTTASVYAHFFSSDPMYLIDRFTFIIHPPVMPVGAEFIFYITYTVHGHDFWDNNYANNYVLECVEE